MTTRHLVSLQGAEAVGYCRKLHWMTAHCEDRVNVARQQADPALNSQTAWQ